MSSLVADVGGTNTRIALARGTAVIPGSIRRYRNVDHSDLTSVLDHYLVAAGRDSCGMACVAVAGPVQDGVAEFTNIGWRIDIPGIARATGSGTVALLNDLQAEGHALGHIAPSYLREIMPQSGAGSSAVQLVVGVGTGFNAAMVHHFASGRHVSPAEAGHVSMPVGNDADLRLAQFIQARQGFAVVEDVLSGRGIENIHAWLGHMENAPSKMCANEIVQALATPDPRSEATLRVFVRLLGVSVGNLALTTLPYGGIYLVGGVSRAIAPYLKDLGFVEAFRDKGRFSGFMESFGVSVIEDEYAALTGCAGHLADCF
ncbi:MAG: ROK family protein [bacterium]|nr:ROK family protein [bacterium]MDE0418532.1 ROK family protein [bacterium]